MTHSTKDTKSNDITSSEGISSVAALRGRNKNVKLHNETQGKGKEINCQKAFERSLLQFSCIKLLCLSFFLFLPSLLCAMSYSRTQKKCVAMYWKKRKLKNRKETRTSFRFLYLLLFWTERKKNAASNNMKFLQCFFAHKQMGEMFKTPARKVELIYGCLGGKHVNEML